MCSCSQSPVDVLPEAVLGIFGYVDDLIALLVLMMFLASLYRRRLLVRQQRVREGLLFRVVLVCDMHAV